MSIIGGILGQAVETQYQALEDAMNSYETEPIKSLKKEKLYMACGMQYFTPESLNEKLPRAEETLQMTADVILDNRQELIETLHISQELTDSQMILEAYKKWGIRCSDYLLGEYAFAIWDEAKKRLFCVRDHVGKRSFYYRQSKQQFIFCTVMAPILKVAGDKVLNDKWLADFLSIQGVIHEVSLDETVYEGIKQLPPGHQMLVTENKIEVEQYWHPEAIKPFKLNTNEAYEKAFRKVFDEAVKCRLRARENIGIMLSSGLDSTAVAAVAAPLLEKQGKQLMSFTEVPVSSYKNQMGQSKIINEAPYVLEMQKKYPNIIPYFNSFEEKNAWKGIDERIQLLEQPYKIIENLYWLEGILEEAQKKHCSVLLDGQFGNFSISQGSIFCYYNTLFHQGKWLSLIKEINAFCQVNHGSRKRAYRVILTKLLKQFKSGQLKIDPLVVVNPHLAKKYQCLKRIKEKGYLFDDERLLQEKTQKQFVTNLVLFSHMGSIETKCSLAYGLLRRDPTRDKRVIEFCLSLPQEQFVQGGIERSLIRRAMKEDVPDSIRLNYRSRGKQAADWVQRLKPYKAELIKEIEAMLADATIAQYIDGQKLKLFLEHYKQDSETDIYGFELKALMMALIFYRFFKSNK